MLSNELLFLPYVIKSYSLPPVSNRKLQKRSSLSPNWKQIYRYIILDTINDNCEKIQCLAIPWKEQS